jgi:hypothetical protein
MIIKAEIMYIRGFMTTSCVMRRGIGAASRFVESGTPDSRTDRLSALGEMWESGLVSMDEIAREGETLRS